MRGGRRRAGRGQRRPARRRRPEPGPGPTRCAAAPASARPGPGRPRPTSGVPVATAVFTVVPNGAAMKQSYSNVAPTGSAPMVRSQPGRAGSTTTVVRSTSPTLDTAMWNTSGSPGRATAWSTVLTTRSSGLVVVNPTEAVSVTTSPDRGYAGGGGHVDEAVRGGHERAGVAHRPARRRQGQAGVFADRNQRVGDGHAGQRHVADVGDRDGGGDREPGRAVRRIHRLADRDGRVERIMSTPSIDCGQSWARPSRVGAGGARSFCRYPTATASSVSRRGVDAALPFRCGNPSRRAARQRAASHVCRAPPGAGRIRRGRGGAVATAGAVRARSRAGSARRRCCSSCGPGPGPPGGRSRWWTVATIDASPAGFESALAAALGRAERRPATAERRRCRPGRPAGRRLRAASPMDDWLRDEFLPALDADDVVVLAGRDGPAAAWRVDPGWRHVVAVHRLEPLDPDESGQLLALAGVAESGPAAAPGAGPRVSAGPGAPGRRGPRRGRRRRRWPTYPHSSRPAGLAPARRPDAGACQRTCHLRQGLAHHRGPAS